MGAPTTIGGWSGRRQRWERLGFVRLGFERFGSKGGVAGEGRATQFLFARDISSSVRKEQWREEIKVPVAQAGGDWSARAVDDHRPRRRAGQMAASRRLAREGSRRLLHRQAQRGRQTQLAWLRRDRLEVIPPEQVHDRDAIWLDFSAYDDRLGVGGLQLGGERGG